MRKQAIRQTRCAAGMPDKLKHQPEGDARCVDLVSEARAVSEGLCGAGGDEVAGEVMRRGRPRPT